MPLATLFPPIKTKEEYSALYKRSLNDSHAFWMEQSESLDWFTNPTQSCIYNWEAEKGNIEHSWFKDGKINVSYNCLDRHLASIGSKTAIIWQADEESEVRSLTYKELHEEVCRFANVLKKQGVIKGDRICIYMPSLPETAIAMLAAARIGAIHSVVFAGFSADSLASRINQASCKLLVTANVSVRGGKSIPLKTIADTALIECPSIEKVIVFKRKEESCPMQEGRDLWYHKQMEQSSSDCQAEILDAEDPLFILYTSGSTGKPKGVLHTQAGYLLHASLSHKYVFDLQQEDIYWCTADVGWITGHSYVVYGPLANGSTTVMFEGTPSYPDCGRFWSIVEKFKVSIFYTAPTAIRSLIAAGDHWVDKYDISSLRILGSVGEPINPETWNWYHKKIGKEKCPIVDTWWQTETGGIMITPQPWISKSKPGSAMHPFFGVEPVIKQGALCIKRPWPGMMRTTWGSHNHFIETYFTAFPGLYYTGDGCEVDEEGDYWLKGRIDDVLNVSGHRIGTAEIENALVSHPLVAETAVVPLPHPIKGEGIMAYVTLITGVKSSLTLEKELIHLVRKEIGPIATIDKIRFTPLLPKTRSGKIMRRLLRKIAANQLEDLGDTSTLADPTVLKMLIEDQG